jgi:hypothetical protein
MPYKSQAQEGLFHSPDSPVGPKEVAHWDAATKGMHLPKVAHMAKGGKVTDKWGIDLTKWANESDADKADDAVRAEGNLEAKAQLEKQRQALVDAQGQQPVQKLHEGGYVHGPVGMKDGGVVGEPDFDSAIASAHLPKVPGKGNKDSVPAMLTPGEVVVSKKAETKMFKPSNTWTHDEDEDGE